MKHYLQLWFLFLAWPVLLSTGQAVSNTTRAQVKIKDSFPQPITPSSVVVDSLHYFRSLKPEVEAKKISNFIKINKALTRIERERSKVAEVPICPTCDSVSIGLQPVKAGKKKTGLGKFLQRIFGHKNTTNGY